MRMSRERDRDLGYTYNKGGNAVSEELVNDFVVKVDTELVNRVISATKGDDTRPGDAKAVALDAVCF